MDEFELQYFVDVIQSDDNNKLHNIFHKGLDSDYMIKFVELCEEDNKQVLLTSIQGSGGYLDYILIGHRKNTNKPVVLLSESCLFKGTITTNNNQLLVDEGGRLSSYSWNSRDFVKGPVKTGQTNINIIPNGYDWQNSSKLKVIIE